MSGRDANQLLPEIGEVVTVRTRLHGGEPAVVRRVEQSSRGFRSWHVWLGGINGSLFGAEGWYLPHEFDREAPDA